MATLYTQKLLIIDLNVQRGIQTQYRIRDLPISLMRTAIKVLPLPTVELMDLTMLLI